MIPNPDPDTISWFRFTLAATTVIGLMGLLAWGLKRFAGKGWSVPIPGTARRLKVVESLSLDARRRLVIVQCDNAQHLLLLGLQQDTVVAGPFPPPSPGAKSATIP